MIIEKWTRRDLLKWSAVGMASMAPGVLAQSKKRISIGVQLWSVRGDCAKDFDAALKQIADLGFEGVEFAGYYKYQDDPAGLKKKLDELSLKAAGTHINANSFVGDRLRKTIDFHRAIGCSYLIVPGDDRFTDPEQSKQYAEAMSKAAEALKREGMFCGHHNHTMEFKRIDDTTYWHLFAERTNKDVVLEMDIGWVRAAGMDPVELMKKYPGRVRLTHVKAKPQGGMGKFFVGQDEYDWKRVLSACYDVGGSEWFLIEQEDYPEGKSPMECTRISIDGLKGILKGMGKS